jgi:hypothetical protein
MVPVHAGRSKSRFQLPLQASSGRDRQPSVSSGPYTGSALSRSHARNVLRAFYAPRLPRRRRSHITLHIKCGVVRLLCRRLNTSMQISSIHTSLLTHCFGRSESRAEAAALCLWAHLASLGARNRNLWRFMTCVLRSVHPVVQGTCFA